MWRALMLAFGLSLCVLGGEFMVVDRLIMAKKSGSTTGYAANPYLNNDYLGASDVGSLGSGRYGRRVFVPPEWAPWGLLSAGVLTVLYGATLPGRYEE